MVAANTSILGSNVKGALFCTTHPRLLLAISASKARLWRAGYSGEQATSVRSCDEALHAGWRLSS